MASCSRRIPAYFKTLKPTAGREMVVGGRGAGNSSEISGEEKQPTSATDFAGRAREARSSGSVRASQEVAYGLEADDEGKTRLRLFLSPRWFRKSRRPRSGQTSQKERLRNHRSPAPCSQGNPPVAPHPLRRGARPCSFGSDLEHDPTRSWPHGV